MSSPSSITSKSLEVAGEPVEHKYTAFSIPVTEEYRRKAKAQTQETKKVEVPKQENKSFAAEYASWSVGPSFLTLTANPDPDTHAEVMKRLRNGYHRGINEQEENSLMTPLLYAAWLHTDEMVKALIEAGADVNAEDALGETAVFKAATVCNIQNLLELLRHKPQDRFNRKGNTALLHLAIAENVGSEELYAILILVKNGANLNVVNKANQTVFSTPHLSVLLIIAEHADRKFLHKKKLLSQAIHNGWTDLALTLIKRNIDPDTYAEMIFYAADKGNLQVLDKLIECVDINVATNKDLLTQLMFRVESGKENDIWFSILMKLIDKHFEQTKLLELMTEAASKSYWKVVQKFIEKNVDCNHRDATGRSIPLDYAIQEGQTEKAILLAKKTHPENRSYALMQALMYRNQPVIDALLALRCDLTVIPNTDPFHQPLTNISLIACKAGLHEPNVYENFPKLTPLMIAVLMRDKESVEKLLKAGANVEFNLDGKTALSEAKRLRGRNYFSNKYKQYRDIIRLLNTYKEKNAQPMQMATNDDADAGTNCVFSSLSQSWHGCFTHRHATVNNSIPLDAEVASVINPTPLRPWYRRLLCC